MSTWGSDFTIRRRHSASALIECDELLRPHLDRPLLSLLYPREQQESLLDRTIYTQPAMFALEYALYELWSSWGLQPNFVLGHSVGEYVAACVAGIFSLEDGLKLIAERARLMQAEPPGGRMVAVRAAEEQVRAAIAPFTRTVSIAAINGPHSVVISGAASDLEVVMNRLAADGVQTKDLNVSHAFHSPLMEPMLAAFEKAVAAIPLQPPTVRLISNLTGRVAKAEEITQPKYWRNHLREPVRFAAGIQTLANQAVTSSWNSAQVLCFSPWDDSARRNQMPSGCQPSGWVVTTGRNRSQSPGASSRGRFK